MTLPSSSLPPLPNTTLPDRAANKAAAHTTAWLIRHGESAANAGLPVSDFSDIPLTPLGRRQAQLFAERFHHLSSAPPTRIVQSPYLRARETAEPLVQRFRSVPVETWPVQEFSYLDPIETSGLNDHQRSPFYARYWGRDDPAHREPNGAEGFTDFMGRVRSALTRLATLPAGERIPVFTHGYFMQGVRLALLFPSLSDRAMMSASLNLNENQPIANTDVLELRVRAGLITLVAHEHITPLTLEPIQPHR